MRAFVLFILPSIISSAVVVDVNPPKSFDYYEATEEAKLLKEDRNHWFKVGKDQLDRILRFDAEPKRNVAKNVVIFLGDGMGISTITAGRIYKGQREFGKSGEDHDLIIDTFPNVALVKTYNVDMQIPDSAGTATALFTGVKTRYEAIGVDVSSKDGEFDPEIYEQSRLESIMTWAQKAGKDTGIITTTRITHATPATTYAHAPHRRWECDSKLPPAAAAHAKDIARQLVEDAPGAHFKVILGGGLQQLGYHSDDRTGECARADRRNLTQLWLDAHRNQSAVFATNSAQLGAVTADTEYLLGLFDSGHLPYELERDRSAAGTPSLSEMVAKGLAVLGRAEGGFVLLVEGGRIDHGHHDNFARLAMQEMAEFDRAIEVVLGASGGETLVLVTADHSHTLTINGYSRRGTDILGYGIETSDEKPTLTLSYANGLGFNYHYRPNESSVLGPWLDTRTDPNRLRDARYRHLATFEVEDESHAGEDVALWAVGPGAHLVRGVVEQNYVAHLISYAACIGPRAELNRDCGRSGAMLRLPNFFLIVLFFCLYFF